MMSWTLGAQKFSTENNYNLLFAESESDVAFVTPLID